MKVMGSNSSPVETEYVILLRWVGLTSLNVSDKSVKFLVCFSGTACQYVVVSDMLQVS